MFNKSSRFLSTIMALVLIFTAVCGCMTTAYADNPPSHSTATLSYGSRGNDVKVMQQMLNTVQNAGLATDGIFGNASKNAVITFQRNNGLTADGYCGPKTWAKLDEVYRNKTTRASVSFSGFSSLSSTQGNICHLNGTISSSGSPIKSINAKLGSLNKTVSCNTYSYSLYNSSLDSAMTFGVLGAGSYTLTYTVTLANGQSFAKSVSVTINPKAAPAPSSGTIKTYSLSRDGNTNITAHFKVREYRCFDGSDKILIDTRVANYMEQIRVHFGKPIVIDSAYRTEAHNKKVGGASKSLHLTGQAVDFQISGVSSRQVAQYAASIGVPGVELDLTNNHVHIDTRSSRYWWIHTSSGDRSVSTPNAFL